MLRLGYRSILPEDLQRVGIYCENQTFEDRIRLIMDSMDVYAKAVTEAHKKEREKQKLNYGEHRVDVDFKVGEFVLWHGPRRKNKLQFQWHGPYRIKEKVNDVKYIVEDPLDGATRNVSVQQIVAILGEFDTMEGDEDLLESMAELQSLKIGHCIVFKRHDYKRLRDVHVGEIVGEYDALDGSITVHYLFDLGPNDRTSSWKKYKPLDQRHVYHEYRDNNGVSTTLNRKTRPARKGELPLQGDYEAHKITIIVKNFVMQTGGKIPRDVCTRTEKWFAAQEQSQSQIDIGSDGDSN